MSGYFAKPGLVFLLGIPLFLSQALPAVGGKNPFFFLLLFLYGFIFMSDPAWQKTIDRHKAIALGLGIAATAGMIAVWVSGVKFNSWSTADILFGLLQTMDTWFWLIALLGYGYKYLNFGHPMLRYANEAAYPFYILHQTILVAVGYFVVLADRRPDQVYLNLRFIPNRDPGGLRSLGQAHRRASVSFWDETAGG